jgi:two-component system OmpR family response regulator
MSSSSPKNPLHPRVLVAEDDADLRRLLQQGLEEEGFDLVMARTGREALVLADSEVPDLVVIDIGLPDSDGRDVCQALRSRGVGVPVLFLTARDTAVDRVSGFGAGGDDYLTKPFEFAELVARLQALQRRQSAARPTVGDLQLDPVGHTIGSPLGHAELTPTEFRLIGTLVGRSGEVVRRREMVAAAWPHGAIVHDNTLDVYVARLRKKLAQTKSGVTIRTVHGVGYRLE